MIASDNRELLALNRTKIKISRTNFLWRHTHSESLITVTCWLPHNIIALRAANYLGTKPQKTPTADAIGV